MNNKPDSNLKMNSLTFVKSNNDNKVKIALPTLCAYGDSDEEEEEEIITNPKLKNIVPSSSNIAPSASAPPSSNSNTSAKKSGLLSILPPPKSHAFLKKDNNSNNDTITTKQTSSQPLLLPRTLKSTSNSISNSSALNNVQTKNTLNSLPITNDSDSDDENENRKKFKSDDAQSSSLFSAKSSIGFKEYKYEPDPEINFGNEKDEEEEEKEDNHTKYNSINYNQNPSVQPTSSNLLDQEAWLKLCGGKRNKLEQIEFTDVNANDIVGDNRSELMKQITEEYKPSANKDYFVGGGRKKSQITYLAYVARERDQELKAMWAQQKHNKQQSRQKYGF